MDSIKTALEYRNTGVISSLFGFSVSLTEVEIWLRIVSLSVGLGIAIVNFYLRNIK